MAVKSLNKNKIHHGMTILIHRTKQQLERMVVTCDNNHGGGCIRHNSSSTLSMYLSTFLQLLLLIRCIQATDMMFPSHHYYERNHVDNSRLLYSSSFPTITPIHETYDKHKQQQLLQEKQKQVELSAETDLKPLFYGNMEMKMFIDNLNQSQDDNFKTSYRFLQQGYASNSSSCVSTERELRIAVRNSNMRNSTQPTLITVCTIIIKLVWFGINLTDHYLIIECSVINPLSKCILDAGGVSRIFHGSNTTVNFRNIAFINGYHKTSGGAISILNSIANFVNCTFFNNSIDGNFSYYSTTEQKKIGGAVMLDKTNATFLDCNFFNNYIVYNYTDGFYVNNLFIYGAALFVNNSVVKIHQCTFFNNTAGISIEGDGGGGGAIFMENSNVDVVGKPNITSFLSNEGWTVRIVYSILSFCS